jgi:hypothetical protein
VTDPGLPLLPGINDEGVDNNGGAFNCGAFNAVVIVRRA